MCLCNALSRVGGSARRQDRGVLDVEIAGTWDFKWPLGSEIRIAFQKPTNGTLGDQEFVHAKAKVQQYAKHWVEVLAKNGCDLGLSFTGGDLDPPLGPEHSTTDQHRSSFHPTDPSKNVYDVLISVADLPVTRVDPFQAYGSRLEPITFPISELGSYARRLDYGAPTMYLGRFAGARQLYATVREYFDSKLAQNIIVHELGHMLGLPHLHQHPWLLNERSTHYRSPRDIQDILGRLLAETPSLELIERNVLDVWPGNAEFSDWLELEQAALDKHSGTSELDSIMTHPYYKFFGVNGAPLPNDPKAIDVLLVPGKLDKEMLSRMYDPSYVPSVRHNRRAAPQPEDVARSA